MEKGIPSIEAAKKARRWLLQKGYSKQAAALKTVACGGAAYGERFKEDCARCKACGSAADGPVHRYWL